MVKRVIGKPLLYFAFVLFFSVMPQVKRALNEMKEGKAPGMDGVRVEMLKEGGCDCIGMVGEIV